MENQEIIEASQELLKLMGITGNINVEKDTETVRVNIETDQSGALIGYHGEGLVALQLILNIITHKKTGTWQKVVVNVGDYRQKREEYLKNLAQNASAKVLATGRPFVLSDLSSFERRIIHLFLADDEKVESVSEGEGQNRRLVIKLKA